MLRVTTERYVTDITIRQSHGLPHRLLVREVESNDAAEGAHQENHIKPTVIEVELESAQHLGYYRTVLHRHVHPKEQHRRDKVHAHYLGQDQDDDVGAFAR